MLLSDRGAFFSHIILRDDRQRKKQMLAAILGHLAPPLWQQMADNALEGTGHVGHLSDYSASLSSFIPLTTLTPRTICRRESDCFRKPGGSMLKVNSLKS